MFPKIPQRPISDKNNSSIPLKWCVNGQQSPPPPGQLFIPSWVISSQLKSHLLTNCSVTGGGSPCRSTVFVNSLSSSKRHLSICQICLCVQLSPSSLGVFKTTLALVYSIVTGYSFHYTQLGQEHLDMSNNITVFICFFVDLWESVNLRILINPGRHI